MKVLGLVGSPRKNSNTDLTVTQILKGTQDSSNQTEKLYLYGLNIAPCVDCRACKTAKPQCVIKDDLQTVYPKLESADVIVFGSPLYWYGPTAQMKLLIDRLRPYVESKKLKGKQAILVISSAEDAEACRFMVGAFELSFEYLGMDFVGKVLVKAYEKAEVAKQPEVLKAAFELGKTLK